MAKPFILIVMPAFNAAKTLEATFKSIPKDCYDEILLVDDASYDNTAQIANKLNIPLIKHRSNQGYGGNLKTCLTYALQKKADITIELHPDNQYDAGKIPLLIDMVAKKQYDLVLGSRFVNDKTPAYYGMHWYRVAANKFLSFFDRFILDIPLSEFHTGFRAYSLKLLKTLPFKNNKDNYTFSFEIIAQAVYFNLKVGEIPVVSRYTKDSTSANIKNSMIYAFETFLVLSKFCLQKYLGFKFQFLKS